MYDIVSVTLFRTSVEKLQSKLSSTEASNSTLQERMTEEEEEAGKLRHERDELREMTERSSAELRKALEVRVCVSVLSQYRVSPGQLSVEHMYM